MTWAPTVAPSHGSSSIASSADGTHLVAAADSIYLSTNTGASWTEKNISGNPYVSLVASSADGSKLIAISSGGSQISTSTDYGNDWATTNFTTQRWYSVAASADGNELLASESKGGVWIYQVAPRPEMNIAISSNTLALSWLVPSTNLVLQENSGLMSANWVTLTNVPALNFTNLDNQITLAPTNASGFFRLSSR